MSTSLKQAIQAYLAAPPENDEDEADRLLEAVVDYATDAQAGRVFKTALLDFGVGFFSPRTLASATVAALSEELGLEEEEV